MYVCIYIYKYIYLYWFLYFFLYTIRKALNDLKSDDINYPTLEIE